MVWRRRRPSGSGHVGDSRQGEGLVTTTARGPGFEASWLDDRHRIVLELTGMALRQLALGVRKMVGP